MRRCIDCQAAVVPWGARAKFRRAKVGLFKRDGRIFLVILITSSDKYKLLIHSNNVKILPAAIRFTNHQLDVFLRDPVNEQCYKEMLRSINVFLKEDYYRQSNKAEVLEKLISLIPLDREVQNVELPQQRSQRKLVSNNVDCRTNRDCIIKIRNVTELPTLLWLRNQLKELSLTECNLKCVPKQLEALSSTLTTLDLSSNCIDKLPRTFCCKMENLKSFDLNHNQIETLPIEIKFLSSLVRLRISDNRLRMIPSTISDLKSLRHLDVANNNLTQLPALTNDIILMSLDVSGNRLDAPQIGEAKLEAEDPVYDETLQYNVSQLNTVSRNKPPRLFELSMLKIVQCDKLFKIASETALPRTIVAEMQRDIFKCSRCGQMSIPPVYISSESLHYLNQVVELRYSFFVNQLTFMKFLCKICFDQMSS